MKINATKFYTSLFVIVLLLQLYLPSFKANVFIQLAVLLFYFVVEKVAVSKGFLKEIAPLFLLMLVGFIGTVIFKYEWYDIIRDISHYLKPITGLLVGYFFYRRIDNFHTFAKTIVVAGIISAVIHLLIIKFLVADNASVHQIREFTKDNFLELFSIFTLLFYEKLSGERIFNNRLIAWGTYGLLTISNVLYLSRTMIVMAILLLMAFYGYTKLNRKTIRILAVLIVAVGLFYSYLYSINVRRNARGLEAFLYKVKMAPEEMFESSIRKSNLKDLWDHWRAYEANRAYVLMEEKPISYAVGTGFGSLVDLNFHAPLTGDAKGIRYISELHNGYAYVIYKTGILGLIIYLFIMAKWYIRIYFKKNLVNIFISTIGVIYLVTTLTITGLYNSRDIIVLLLGGLLYFAYKEEDAKITKSGE